MPVRSFIVGLALLFACAAWAGNRPPADSMPNTAVLPLWERTAAEPPTTRLIVGDEAPLFTYLGTEGGWRPFSELLSDGPVLLVFGAREGDLMALQQARPLFLELGVSPVVVLDRRASSTASLARRLNLSCPIIPDPMRAIADLYNTLDPRSLRPAPSFFVLDENHRIRVLSRGPLPSAVEMLSASARGLNRPLPESTWNSIGS